MVGSKLDLKYKRAVSIEDAAVLAKENNLHSYLECSSKDGHNVNEVFFEIGHLMLKNANMISS